MELSSFCILRWGQQYWLHYLLLSWMATWFILCVVGHSYQHIQYVKWMVLIPFFVWFVIVLIHETYRLSSQNQLALEEVYTNGS